MENRYNPFEGSKSSSSGSSGSDEGSSSSDSDSSGESDSSQMETQNPRLSASSKPWAPPLYNPFFEGKKRRTKKKSQRKESNNLRGRVYSKQHIRMMMIGKSGAGKTTLINMMVNLFFEKKYLNDERLIAITQNLKYDYKKKRKLATDFETELERKDCKIECNIDLFKSLQTDKAGADQRISQTTSCNTYTVRRKNLKLSIIDTPGICDTNGIEQDRANVQSIVDALKVMEYVDCICIVHSASVFRLDDMYLYLINELKCMLPKSMKTNIALVFTNTINKLKVDTTILREHFDTPSQHVYYFENDCLIPFEVISNNDKNDLVDEEYKKRSAAKWKSNGVEFVKMLAAIDKSMEPVRHSKVIRIQSYRIIVQKYLNSILEMHKKIFKIKEKISGYKEEIEEAEKELKDNSEHTKTVNKMVEVKRQNFVQEQSFQDLEEGKKINQCYTCLTVCHDACDKEILGSATGWTLLNCKVFNGGGNCIVCGHLQTEHKLSTKQIFLEVKTVEVKCQEPKKKVSTDKMMKIRYEQAEKNILKLKQSKRDTESTLEGNERLIRKYESCLFICLEELGILAFDRTNESILNYLSHMEKEIKGRKFDFTKSTDVTLRSRLLEEVELEKKKAEILRQVKEYKLKVLHKDSRHEVESDFEKEFDIQNDLSTETKLRIELSNTKMFEIIDLNHKMRKKANRIKAKKRKMNPSNQIEQVNSIIDTEASKKGLSISSQIFNTHNNY